MEDGGKIWGMTLTPGVRKFAPSKTDRPSPKGRGEGGEG